METKHLKRVALACAMLSSVVAMSDAGNVAHGSTNGLVSVNANPATNVNPSIRFDIQALAVGLAGNADVTAMHDAASRLFSRIEAGDDADTFHAHMENMQNAILGIRFREGPLADSYDGWVDSIDRYEGMCDRCASVMWKQTRDWQWVWEFRLKQMAVARKERERIADAKWKPYPPNFDGVHKGLSCVQDAYRCCIENILRRVFAWNDHFSDFYHGLPQSKQETWRNRIEAASGMKFEFSPEIRQRVHDREVRKPYDGGDVLTHPFSFLGCTFGNAYDLSRLGGKDTYRDVILCWFKNFRIDPYFGKVWMMLSLAPRSKIAYSAKIEWWGQNTREELFAFAKDIRADIEKRLGVKLGEFFFEGRSHVCDEATWWKADWGCARSRSVFGPILIELEAADQPGNRFPSSRCFSLVITDTAAEAIVEKERKENPLTYDSKAEQEAERRKFEKLKEMNRRRKVIPAKNTTK